MVRQFFLLSFLLMLAGSNPVHAQPKPAEQQPAQRPDLRPGDKLEVIDMGKLREAEFVEFTPVGLIKVRFEDDSQVPFRPQFVRWAKGINPRGENPNPASRNGQRSANQGSGQSGQGTKQPANQDPRVRTWKDASGMFSVTAQFVGLSAGKVELRKADGKIVRLELEKLSADDQEAARALAEVTPAANPFEVEVTDPWAIKRSGPSAWMIDVTRYENHRLGVAKKWGVQPDPGAAAVEMPTKNFTVATGPTVGQVDWRARTNGLLVDPRRQWLWAGVNCETDGVVRHGRLERFDLAKGTLLESTTAPLSVQPIDVDPTGKYVATLRDDANRNKNAIVDLWTVEGNQVQLAESFLPFGGVESVGKRVYSVNACWFLDDKHLLTFSGYGGLILWDVAQRRPAWVAELGRQEIDVVALSPGRKQLALATNDYVSLINPMNGSPLGQCEIQKGFNVPFDVDNMGFSADGKYLAVRGTWQFWLCDLTTGKVKISRDAGQLIDAGKFPSTFGPQGHVIFDNKIAYDARRGVFTAEYEGDWQAATNYAGRQWYLWSDSPREGTQYSVTSTVVPGTAVLEKVAAVPEVDLLVVKPGGKVQLKMNLLFDPATNERIRANLVERIGKAGWVHVESEAEYELILTMTATNHREIDLPVRSFQTGQRTVEKVKVFDVVGKTDLQAVTSTRSLWSREITWRPPDSALRKVGQTLEEIMRPDPQPDFFTACELPAHEIVYPKGRALEKIRLTPDGQETAQ